MSKFTHAGTCRRVPKYRPPSALLWADKPAPAQIPDPPKAPRPEPAPAPQPTPRINSVRNPDAPLPTNVILIRDAAYHVTAGTKAGNPSTGPGTSHTLRRLGARPGETPILVIDYQCHGPQCYCEGMPRAACEHIEALRQDGRIEPDPSDDRWTITREIEEGGQA